MVGAWVCIGSYEDANNNTRHIIGVNDVIERLVATAAGLYGSFIG